MAVGVYAVELVSADVDHAPDLKACLGVEPLIRQRRPLDHLLALVQPPLLLLLGSVGEHRLHEDLDLNVVLNPPEVLADAP